MSDVVKKLKRGRRWSCGEALVLVAILIVAVCLLLPAVQVVVWVGSRDVDFTVLVLDAETQSPIANATVQQYDEILRALPPLQTDASGQVHFREHRTSAGKSGLFVNTMSVALPPRLIWAQAKGYISTEPIEFHEFRNGIRHVGATSELTIRLELHKQSAGK